MKAPKNEEPAAGNSLRKVQQNFETLKTEVQFTKHCQEAAFIREVAVGRFYRTALDVDDGLGDRTPACREYTGPRAHSDSRIFTAIKQRTIIGPFLQVHIITCLGTYGIEIQRPSTTSPKETSREVICRGQNRYVEELPHLEPGPNPTSKEILRERDVAKENEPSAAETNQSRMEETHATQELVPANPVYCVKETALMGERTLTLLSTNGTGKMLFRPKSQNVS